MHPSLPRPERDPSPRAVSTRRSTARFGPLLVAGALAALTVGGAPDLVGRTLGAAPGVRQAAPTPTPIAFTLAPRSPTTAPPTATPLVLAVATATATPAATASPTATATPTATPTASPTPRPTATPVPVARADFAAADWVGGFYRGDSEYYGRPWVAVYGAFSDYPRAALTFALDRAPAGPATLTVAGLDDEWAELNEIALEVNGERVFAGPSWFANWDGVGTGADAAWTRIRITLPADLLRAGPNEIAIANLTPVASFNSPPYVLLAETTLRVPGATITTTTEAGE